ATNACPLGVVQKVLQSLVKEKVPIRDLLTIVEALADYGPFTKDPEVLAEYVRQRLGKVIIKPFLKANGTLPVITMDFSIEEQIKKGIQQTEHGSFLALDAASVQHLAQAIKKGVEDATAKGYQAVILTSPNIRRHLKKLIDRFAPNVSVLSHTEIQGNVKLESIAAIR
ncbi:MAG: FHIPEP family type III secretion protein, partial [Dissulfurimicrobium sp.]